MDTPPQCRQAGREADGGRVSVMFEALRAGDDDYCCDVGTDIN